MKVAQTRKAMRWTIAAWIGLAVFYVLLRIHSLGIPLDRDEGMFAYGAQRILEGGKPYLDFFDHKPPGIFYIYTLPVVLFPPTSLGIHSFLSGYNFCTMILLALLMRWRFGGRASLGAALCYALFSASPAIQGYTASTEMLMLLPSVACLLLAVVAQRTGRHSLAFLSGAVGASAFWIKQTAGMSVLFALIYLAAARWLDSATEKTDSTRYVVKNLLLWLAGAIAVSAIIVGYFWTNGLLHEFFYWSFSHNIEYTAHAALGDTAAGVIQSVGEILRADFGLVGLGLAAILWSLWRHPAEGRFLLGFLLLSFVGTLPGFFYAHYFAQMAPAIAMAAGWGLSLLAGGTTSRRRIAMGVVLIIVIAVPVYVGRDYFFFLSPDEISRRYFGENPFPEAAELSAFLASRTKPNDRIFIAGSEPEILFEAQRKSATPFVMIYPLTQLYPGYQEFQNRLWHDIDSEHPAYILTTNIAMSILWDGKASMATFEQLADKLLPEYDLEAIMPVREPRGRLIQFHNDTPDSDFNPDEPMISVYRRAH